MAEKLCSLKKKGRGDIEYATMSIATGSYPRGLGYTSDESLFSLSGTAFAASNGTITVLKEGTYTFIALAGNRSVATASVTIGNTTVAIHSGPQTTGGSIYIPANTVCTLNTSGDTSLAVLTLIKH